MEVSEDPDADAVTLHLSQTLHTAIGVFLSASSEFKQNRVSTRSRLP